MYIYIITYTPPCHQARWACLVPCPSLLESCKISDFFSLYEARRSDYHVHCVSRASLFAPCRTLC